MPAASAPTALPVVLLVTLERAGQRELAELVPQHLGDDRRAPRPGLDHVLGALVVLNFHLLEQVVVYERALLQAARHVLSPSAALTRGVAAADDQPVTRLALTAGAALGLTLR